MYRVKVYGPEASNDWHSVYLIMVLMVSRTCHCYWSLELWHLSMQCVMSQAPTMDYGWRNLSLSLWLTRHLLTDICDTLCDITVSNTPPGHSSPAVDTDHIPPHQFWGGPGSFSLHFIISTTFANPTDVWAMVIWYDVTEMRPVESKGEEEAPASDEKLDYQSDSQ